MGLSLRDWKAFVSSMNSLYIWSTRSLNIWPRIPPKITFSSRKKTSVVLKYSCRFLDLLQGYMKYVISLKYLNEFHLVNEHIHSCEDQTRFEVPLDYWLLLKVSTQLSPLFKVETLEICTELEGKLHLLQPLIWFHLQDLFWYKGLSLVCITRANYIRKKLVWQEEII